MFASHALRKVWQCLPFCPVMLKLEHYHSVYKLREEQWRLASWVVTVDNGKRLSRLESITQEKANLGLFLVR